MGYYKQIDSETQANIDRIVRWYNEHQETVPAYILRRILSDVDLLDDMIDTWEEIPEPLPVTRHVALRSRHRKPATDWSMTSGQGKVFVAVYTVTMLLVLAGVIGLAVL